MLETIAAVPGFVAGMIHHMRSLRRMVHCNWIKPVMDEGHWCGKCWLWVSDASTYESENERMHLMTFMELSNQRWHQRVLVVCGQGAFFAAYTLFYVLTPRIAHRFVGYLEEEAVHTYTEMLKMVDEEFAEHLRALGRVLGPGRQDQERCSSSDCHQILEHAIRRNSSCESG